MLNASDAMLSMRSAIHYKYNPSMRYVVELYPHSTEELGEVRAGLRTQNPSLLLYIGQFYKLWAGLERAYLEGPPRRSEALGLGLVFTAVMTLAARLAGPLFVRLFTTDEALAAQAFDTIKAVSYTHLWWS